MSKATYYNEISAGWAIVGIGNSLRRWAWECGVDIEFSTSYGVLGRSISFRIRGDEESVLRFRLGVENIRTKSVVS